MSPRATTRLAWTLWTISLLLVVSMSAFYLLGLEIPLEDRDRPPPYFVTVLALMPFAFSTVGALVASRRPQNAVGWIFCGIGLIAGVGFSGQFYADWALIAERGAVPGGRIALWLVLWVFPPMLTALTLYALHLPEGTLLTRRWRIVLWLALAGGLALALGEALDPGELDDRNYPGVENPVGIAGGEDLIGVVTTVGTGAALLALVLAVSSMIVRFRRSSGIERQQLKWIAYSGALAAAAFIGVLLITTSPLDDIMFTIAFVSLIGVPVSTGIAILRYRLYDIDVVINRTLVYGSVTAGLAATYVGLVLLLQLAFSTVTEGSGLAVALSTLAVAALFRPARNRVQALVDRRFYRRKYDAQRTLEGFAARLRDEVDLDSLRVELTGVVGDTMRPAHVSLWLREAGQ